MERRQTLYRFFDADGSLLYIGVSMTPWERFRQHRTGKPWWDDIATITKQNYPSREAVLEAERDAIVAEAPRYNVQHNGGLTKTALGETQATGKVDCRRADGPPLFTVTSRSGHVITGEFRLVYEVHLDPIGDDYYWDDVDPRQLFIKWYDKVSRRCHSGYVPIYWFVEGPAIFEAAVADHDLFARRGGYHAYYDDPLDQFGNVVELRDLPVIDKKWGQGEQDKGGFLPIATGWKPYALQREVAVRDLRNMVMRRHWMLVDRQWELVA